jgi:hypothetical protein
MSQPQIPSSHAPLEHFPPLTNNTIKQTNETQNTKQPDHYIIIMIQTATKNQWRMKKKSKMESNTNGRPSHKN